MFQIKICGITNQHDAALVADAGADAIGLNFCEASVRCVSLSTAAHIAKQLSDSVARVGVFVNAQASTIVQAADEVGLDYIQLHGDESPDVIADIQQRLPQQKIIRALRCGAGSLDDITSYLTACQQIAVELAGVLIDALVPGQYGGTGSVVNWDLLSQQRDKLARWPVVLAGGLRPNNVAQAIAKVVPSAVDTASGVEAAPGRKDPALVHQFVEQARAAFGSFNR